MGDKSKIEWTEATWNPVRGCSKVSEGCRNCYAMSVAARFSGPGQPYEGLAHRVGGQAQWTNKIMLVEDALALPLRWQKPRRIFVNSMSDLFHEGIPDDYIDRVFAVMALAPQHTFQVLTKRPERMREYLNRQDLGMMIRNFHALAPDSARKGANSNRVTLPLPNVWLGVSVEDQPTADLRRDPMLKIAAQGWLTWISYEPALGPVDWTGWLKIAWQCSGCRKFFPGCYQAVCPSCNKRDHWTGSHKFNPPGGQVGPGVSWIVVGGESGPNARPMHPEWARKTRDQCVNAGVPYFFKQWGEFAPINSDTPCPVSEVRTMIGLEPDGRVIDYLGLDIVAMWRPGKKRAGRILDKRTWDEYPEAAR